MPVVVHFDRCVDAQQQRQLLGAAVAACDCQRHILLRFQIAGDAADVETSRRR